MKYEVRLILRTWVKTGGGQDGYEAVEANAKYTFKDWDDVSNLLGYLTEGADGSAVKVEIKMIGEDDNGR